MTLVDTDPATTAVTVEHLCDFAITFQTMQTFSTPLGTRMIAVVDHGTVEGPRLRGEFLPGGGDWIIVGSDRVARLDVRATLRTHDDELVFVTVTGRASLSDEAIGRLWAGETIGWDEMHARSAPLFESGADRYAWLNSTVAIAVNELSLNHVHYRVYSIQ
ncbi:DUF3237 domain-containing protein [Nonomuraea basaltis]|uniref:DUF3237 domain-containing protein n=1 Tax=Nonomuraea basaltis TaxID=2495887 RepID=UPI00110C66CA|nr:DUF3237 domain-containing protein [Nonomuraea basaltis]TMR91671.1 DUF3237 domain-containing protein [Nonomuraea basaltis]